MVDLSEMSEMLEFLMSHDIILSCSDTGRSMTADEAFVLGGEFVVYESHNAEDLYRGTDLDEAIKVLEGKYE